MITAKLFGCMAVLSGTSSVFCAVAEPASQTALYSLLSLIVATVGTFGTAWIALQHAKLSQTVQTLEKNTNSMKDALVASTAKASLAEGIIQERQSESVRKAEIVIAIGQKQSQAVPLKPVEAAQLERSIDAVPEKTASRVVEKLKE